MNQQQYYFENESKRGINFFLVLSILLLLIIHTLFVDYGVFLQKEKMKISQNYLSFLLYFDIFTLISILGLYFLRKIAVYVFPVLIMIHFIFHLNYLATFLYTDVFMMFFYVGIGLLVFIPKWRYFK